MRLQISVTAAFCLCAGSASACTMPGQIDYLDVLHAELVVIGTVEHQGLVIAFPDGHGVARLPRFSLRINKVLQDTANVLPDPPGSISVAFSETRSGVLGFLKSAPFDRFLVVLDGPALKPESFGDSAPEPWPEFYLLQQEPCTGPLIFGLDMPVGLALRQAMTTDRDRDVEWQVLSDFLFATGANGLFQRQTAP